MSMVVNKSVSTDTYQTDEQRWDAVTRRDPAADGNFYYAVRTTGVYCRPSCGARPARRENVSFHMSPEAAERAGFRPCKRCRPDQASAREQHSALIAAACHQLQTVDPQPGLQTLADAAGMSRFHFHRLFKQLTGLTPKAYAQAHRTRRVQQELASGSSVTDAIYAAGYNSNSRFYATSSADLGMKPSHLRQGGRNERIRFAVAATSLGSVLVAATQRGVCAILLGDDPQALLEDLQDRFRSAELVGADAEFEQWVARVIGLIEAPRAGADLPLDLQGTAFQQRVWQALRHVPPGATITYAQLAQKLGAPKAVRAVAQACGANPLAVAIPCHRVIRTDGSVCGYRWGVDRKRTLLERERQP
jgi:AraC family transcriptional regulator, regulatory protein of adaptative response / methylated-DNA-[protein]-cysteine methyltransferase